MDGHPGTTFRTQVEWIDTDAAGIYHNSTVARWVEAAEARLMAGPGLHDYFRSAPRVSYHADFEAPLFFGQEVTVHLEVTELGSSSMTFGFEVWGEEHGGRPRRRAARGSYVTVHVEQDHDHPDGARSSPWPAGTVAALQGQGRAQSPA
ncbi:acyl-CoA thioesterase [Marmoricola sp. RAF53]|uniref:acyl-CoA thioesterase n=1 Tax=Marmoricola sp. RAF53 TaxID=3233059 RepID=UPI003F997891